MNTKLTLSINKSVTEKAKRYARQKKTSLSKLIENQLSKITGSQQQDDISPLVKSLSGVISSENKSTDKKNYAAFLIRKYK